MTNPFTARWTAQGHTLCLGHWEICFDQQLLELPSAKAENHMDTRGIFSWLFPDDEEYIEGLEIHEWIEEQANWLVPLFERYDIPFDEQHVEWFYEAVNQNDWRCGSCGGCL